MTDLEKIDAPNDLRENVSACVAWSESNQIVTPEDFQTTGEHLKQIKTGQKQADEFFDPAIAQAHSLHKMLVGRKKMITDPLASAEKIDKQKMLTFQQAELAKAEAERRRLQAIADEKERAERLKLEQAAAEQRRKETEAREVAERARREAEQADAETKKRLLAEAESAERRAETAAAKAEAKSEQAVAVMAPVIAVAVAAPKIAGVSTKTVWKFRVVNPAVVPDDYKLVDEKKLGQYARMMGRGAKLPGVEFYPEESLSSKSF